MGARSRYTTTAREEREADLFRRAAIATKELRRIRRMLRLHPDEFAGREVQEDGMLKQANPHGSQEDAADGHEPVGH